MTAPRSLTLAWVLLLLLPAVLTAADTAAALRRGDDAYAHRAEGSSGSRADPAPIGRAVAAYEEAHEEEEQNLEARWKLLRALYFQGEYVVDDDTEKLELFARARDLAEDGLDLLAGRVGGRERLDRLKPEDAAARLAGEPEAAPLYFWAAAHWGLWGQLRGKLAAARQGVGRRIRDYARVVIALDERFEEAGGHRILGRLHTEAPKIPLFTGWVDRELAVAELERAVELAPDNLLNRLYLAEAILEHRPARRDEAIELLRDLASRVPRPGWEVEEAGIIADSQQLLSEGAR